MKQVTVRPNQDEYRAFLQWWETSLGVNVSESAAFCELIKRYFDYGQERELPTRIERIESQLNEIQLQGV